MRMSIIAASSWSEKVQPTSLLEIFMKVVCSTCALNIWQRLLLLVGRAPYWGVVTSSSVAARPMRTRRVPTGIAGKPGPSLYLWFTGITCAPSRVSSLT